jgi:hypothetical protein
MNCAVSSARLRASLFVSLMIAGGLLLSACGGEEEQAATAAAAPSPADSTPQPAVTPPPPPAGGANPAPTNQAPTIAGIPSTSVMQGTEYSFTPSAADANGDVLTFSITGQPAWTTFTTSNGRLRGTPGPGDVGTSSNIRISVTDGTATTTLAAFSVQVVATATGSATLSWNPPTQNSDGTSLTNLAGFKVYWGSTQGSYPNSVTLNNPGLSTYMVEQLTPATWYFVTTSFNGQGVESSYSNVASKTVL